MDSDAATGRRLARDPVREEAALRRRLLQRYGRHPDFKWLVHKVLSPLWDEAKLWPPLDPYASHERQTNPDYVSYAPYWRVLRALDIHSWRSATGEDEDTFAAQRATLEAYLKALREAVHVKMGLTARGEPPEWAVDYLHQQVWTKLGTQRETFHEVAISVGTPDGRSIEVDDESDADLDLDRAAKPLSASLDLTLWPTRAHLRLITGGHRVITDEALDEDGTVIPLGFATIVRQRVPNSGPSPFFSRTEPVGGSEVTDQSFQGDDAGFNNWGELEREACALVHEAIARMRATYQDDLPQRNVASLAQENLTLDRLFDHYFKNRRFQGDERKHHEAVRRLAKRIGLDFPKRLPHPAQKSRAHGP